MGGTYRQVGDYFIPNLVSQDDSNYQIGKYGRMRRSYLKE
ncbi:MAG: TnpV protein, partial [Clostridiales bacterium]|nr:TnpV protein [Clostridiales bacterium]